MVTVHKKRGSLRPESPLGLAPGLAKAGGASGQAPAACPPCDERCAPWHPHFMLLLWIFTFYHLCIFFNVQIILQPTVLRPYLYGVHLPPTVCVCEP